MNTMEFIFEESPWEQVISAIPTGGSLSAARLLALLEGETQEQAEDAFSLLEQKKITLDIGELAVEMGGPEMALRLRKEQQFVASGMPLDKLEETDPLRVYLEELSFAPTAGDPQMLAEKLLAGDDSAAKRIADVLIGGVVTTAADYTGKGVLLLDLIQEGSLGLWQGIMAYDGGDIRDHCDWWIRQYMAKAVTEQASANGVGQKMKNALEDYRDIDRKLLDELGRNPTLEEIAEQLHITPEAAMTVEQMLTSARTVAKAHEEAAPKEQTPEDEQAVEDTAYFQSRQRIMEMLSGLSEEDAKLLSLRFGLEGGLPLSPEETGIKLGLTPAEVVARETAALSKLRQDNHKK